MLSKAPISKKIIRVCNNAVLNGLIENYITAAAFSQYCYCMKITKNVSRYWEKKCLTDVVVDDDDDLVETNRY